MLNILAVCENSVEVQSIAPVARELERKGNNVNVEFASQDALLCQGVDEAIRECGRKKKDLPYPVSLSKSLLTLTAWRKLKILLQTDYHFRGVMREYDGLLCGIDAVAARILIADARRYGVPAFQILPSLKVANSTCTSVTRTLKDIVRRFVGYVTGAEFLTYPNTTGGSYCDRLFVVGEQTKEALIEKGIPGDRIYAYGIPRFTPLFDRGTSSGHRPDECRILYLSGSFEWHGDRRSHRAQQRQLCRIVEALRKRKAHERPELLVKVHPRSNSKNYDWLRDEDVGSIIPPEVDLYQCIRDCTVAASICSTAMYEAVLLGRISILTAFEGGENISDKNMREDILCARSAQELVQRADVLHSENHTYERELAEERDKTEGAIDPDTPQSPKLIANNVLTYLASRH